MLQLDSMNGQTYNSIRFYGYADAQNTLRMVHRLSAHVKGMICREWQILRTSHT